MKEPNMFHNYETEKITRKASDMAKKPAIMSSCSVLPPEIVMNDAYIGERSENIKCTVHEDLGWKNRTTRYHVIIGFGELAAVN